MHKCKCISKYKHETDPQTFIKKKLKFFRYQKIHKGITIKIKMLQMPFVIEKNRIEK